MSRLFWQTQLVCKKCNKPECQELYGFSQTLEAINTLSSRALRGTLQPTRHCYTVANTPLRRQLSLSEIPATICCTAPPKMGTSTPSPCPCLRCLILFGLKPDITGDITGMEEEINPEPGTDKEGKELEEDTAMKVGESEDDTFTKFEESEKDTSSKLKESEKDTPTTVEEPEMYPLVYLIKSVKGTPMQINTPKNKSVNLIASGSTNNKFEIDFNRRLVENRFKPMHKGNILEKRALSFIKLVYNPTYIQVDIFDEDSAPVLSKQIIRKENKITEKFIHFLAINDVSYLVEELKIPQISTIINQTYLCPLIDCNEGFIDFIFARNHALSHLDHRPFSCAIAGCDWTFAKENHLQRHLITHENTKNYPCDEPGCDKLFTTIYNLNEHRKKRHVQPATKPCPVLHCSELFRNSKELNKHCKQHDQREAPFQCPSKGCNRSFYFQNILEVHTKRHLKENMHICTYNDCNKIFQQAYRLKEHMRCHTGTKPYNCTIRKCTKAFSTASKLKRHEQSHFNDKHNYCNIEGCDKAFKRSDHLKEHIRQVHKYGTPSVQNVSLKIPVEVANTEPLQSTSFAKNGSEQFLNALGTESLQTAAFAQIEEEANLSNLLAMNLSSDSNVPSCSKTDDELLDAALKSIGGTEINLETDLFLDEPLDLSDFSTVNLRDLL